MPRKAYDFNHHTSAIAASIHVGARRDRICRKTGLTAAQYEDQRDMSAVFSESESEDQRATTSPGWFPKIPEYPLADRSHIGDRLRNPSTAFIIAQQGPLYSKMADHYILRASTPETPKASYFEHENFAIIKYRRGMSEERLVVESPTSVPARRHEAEIYANAEAERTDMVNQAVGIAAAGNEVDADAEMSNMANQAKGIAAADDEGMAAADYESDADADTDAPEVERPSAANNYGLPADRHPPKNPMPGRWYTVNGKGQVVLKQLPGHMRKESCLHRLTMTEKELRAIRTNYDAHPFPKAKKPNAGHWRTIVKGVVKEGVELKEVIMERLAPVRITNEEYDKLEKLRKAEGVEMKLRQRSPEAQAIWEKKNKKANAYLVSRRQQQQGPGQSRLRNVVMADDDDDEMDVD